MKVAFSLAASALIAVFSLGSAPAFGETLEEAIALAYETNPTLLAQRSQVRVLDESYVQARAGLRPQLSASSTASYSNTSVNAGRGGLVDTNGDGIPDTNLTGSGVTERNFGNASVSVTQPVYTGGRTIASMSAAAADILSARETLRDVEAGVLLNVVQTYSDVLRDQRVVEIRRQDADTLQKRLEETQARFEVGELTRTDVAQAEARLGSSRAQLEAAEGQQVISRANYETVVGQQPSDLAPQPALDEILPSHILQAFDIAMAESPKVRAAELTEHASRARVAMVRAQRRPTVSLRAGYGYSGQVDPFIADRFARNLSASVTTTVPIYSGGVLSSQIRQAVERNNTDRIRVETANRQVRQAIAQSWSQMTTARASAIANEGVVRAAKVAVEGTRLEFEVGLRTTLDVLNAELELRNAELALVAARRDAYVASASLLNAIGRLEAKRLAPETALYEPGRAFRRVSQSGLWAPIDAVTETIDRIGAPPGAAMPSRVGGRVLP